MNPIPISAAKRIADSWGYDQAIIIARKVGPNGGEHVTTYGVDEVNCGAAARIGTYLKYAVMKWLEGESVKTVPKKAGFYWAKWKIADEGTPEGDEQAPSNKWEVVQVFENTFNSSHPDHLRVSVHGQPKSQSLENFFWGRGPLEQPK